MITLVLLLRPINMENGHKNFSRRTILNIGIRNSIHFTTDKQLYAFPEPRIALKTKLGKNNWFKSFCNPELSILSPF